MAETGTKAPASRTLNYALTGDVMNRVADAAMSTELVEVQKMKTGIAATEAITKSAAAFGGAVITGPKKSAELKKKFDNGISRDQFATAEAYNNYTTSLQPLKDEYIEAVRMGNTAEQQRILSQLQNGKAFLEKSKEGWENIRNTVDAGDNIEDTRIASVGNQSAMASLLDNTKVTYEEVDGAQYEVIDYSEDALEELQSIDEYYAPDRDANGVPIPNSLENSVEGVVEQEKINLVQSWMDGTAIGEFDFYDANGNKMVDGFDDPAKMYEDIKSGKVTVKRRFSPRQKEDLLKSQSRPTALLDSIENMQTTLQDGASAENPTYFDYEKIRSNLEINMDMGNARHLAFNMKPVLGSNFGEDFLDRDFRVAGKNFSTSIPINENENLAVYDMDPKDGVISPEELTKITKADKKILLEYMLKPENKDIFAKEWSEWATAKLYNTSWKPGYDSRKHDKALKALDTYTDAYGNVYFTGVQGTENRAASLPQGEAVGPYRP